MVRTLMMNLKPLQARLRSFSHIAAIAICSLTGANPSFGQTAPTPVGINLVGVDYWTTEHPFSNLAQHASRWRTQPVGKPFTWDAPLPPMSKEEYPTRVPNGTMMESFLIWIESREHLSKELVVLYDGRGELSYAGGARLKERSPGRDLIQDLREGRGPIIARIIQSEPSDPVRNIRLYETSAAHEPSTFRQAFLKRMSGMSAIRFMDWMKTNNSEVRKWEDRPRKNRFTQTEGGVALEYMIELANKVKAAPWFNIPHLADDDYVRRFAQQVLGDLDPGLPVYVEYSNEVWNGIFKQAGYAAQKGQELHLSSDTFEAQLRYYSQRTTEILKIWKGVFGAQSDRVIGVYAAQAANPWTSRTVLDWKDAHEYADVLAVAPYFGQTLGNPDTQDKVAGWGVDRVLDVLTQEVATANKKMIQEQADVAREMNVRLVAYEGGQHLAGILGAENNQKLEQLFSATNRDPRMKAIYLTHFANWKAAGGDLYMVFSSMGLNGKWGSWGLLETEDQDVLTAPKWMAVQEFMSTNKLTLK